MHFYLFILVCICVVCMCVCTCATCVWRPETDIRLHFFLYCSILYIFIHCLSLSLELTNYLDLLVSEPQVFSSSLLSSCGIAGVLPHLAAINWGSECRPS